MADHYATLGVSPTASQAEIKAAYHKRAIELHPDKNPSPDATAQFQALGEAYAVLSNPESRDQYDQLMTDSFGIPGRPDYLCGKHRLSDV
jgi:curved DNA-binding protein CbpA